jgi:predicted nucleic acid-binding protein
VILADTGVVLALLDADDRHHEAVVALFRETGNGWLLPWAILPEVDYLIGRHGGPGAGRAFQADLAGGAWPVEWGTEADLEGAHRYLTRYRDLRLGLVDAVVMSMAERLEADAIATLDLRHFGAVEIPGAPRLLPRDA